MFNECLYFWYGHSLTLRSIFLLVKNHFCSVQYILFKCWFIDKRLRGCLKTKKKSSEIILKVMAA